MYYVIAEVRDYSSQSMVLVRVGRKYKKPESAIRLARKYCVAKVIDYSIGFRKPIFTVGEEPI